MWDHLSAWAGIVGNRVHACRDLQAALSAFEGVVGIGCGQSTQSGKHVCGSVLRVYVASKQQWTDQGGEAVLTRLRASHSGIEVVVHAGAGIACSSTPNLYPGDEIARDVDTNSNEGRGTLGLIVTKSGQTARYLLTNFHVFNQSGASINQDVYKPHKTSCNKPVATVPNVADPVNPPFPKDMAYTLSYVDPAYPGLTFDIDAALAAINSGIKSSNVNPDISGKIPQFGPTLRDLVTEFALKPVTSNDDMKALNATVAAKKIAVQKFGARTGYTRGLIVGACVPHLSKTSNITTYPFTLVITPDPGYAMSPLTATFAESEVTTITDDFDAQAFPPVTKLTVGPVVDGKQEIKLSGNIFNDHGDSGAVLLDLQGQVVGLVHGFADVQSLNTGLVLAQFIVPVFDALGLAHNAVVPPGAAQSGMAIGQIQSQPDAMEESLIDAAERVFGGTPVGARLLRLARMHLDEIQRVLHHRRRGVVAWHRNKGPAYVAAISRAVRSGGRALPSEIDGVRIGDALRHIGRVLSIEGSATLRQSIQEHGDWLIETLERATDPAAALHLLLGTDSEAPGAATACLRIVNIKGTPGTASALIRCEDGVLRCLTNHHVLFGSGGGAGDTVFAVDDCNGRPRLIAIGTTTCGHIGRVMHSGSPVFVDCALATLGNPASWPASLRRQLGALPVLREFLDPSIGSVVTKEGAATGRTTGCVVDIAYPDRPCIEGLQYDAPGQLLVRPLFAAGIVANVETNFCAAGDSGAVVFDPDGRAAGLLWGANANGEGIACPIRAVIRALGIEATGATPELPSLMLVES